MQAAETLVYQMVLSELIMCEEKGNSTRFLPYNLTPDVIAPDMVAPVIRVQHVL